MGSHSRSRRSGGSPASSAGATQFLATFSPGIRSCRLGTSVRSICSRFGCLATGVSVSIGPRSSVDSRPRLPDEPRVRGPPRLRLSRLGLTALALVVALTTATNRTSLRQPQPWIAAVGIGVGIAGQVLAWEAGPLLVLPASLVVLGQTLLDVSNDRSALVRNAPVLAAFASENLIRPSPTPTMRNTRRAYLAATAGALTLGTAGCLGGGSGGSGNTPGN